MAPKHRPVHVRTSHSRSSSVTKLGSLAPLTPTSPKKGKGKAVHKPKAKAGFTLSGGDSDDEWVSSHPSSSDEESKHEPVVIRPTRPASLYGDSLRPHPLIRGQSHGLPSRASPLAPLTVKPQVSPEELPLVSVSPDSYRSSLARRRLSTSSTRSLATLPDRTRTISSGSSSALSSLAFAIQPHHTAPSHLTCFFPPQAHKGIDINKIHPLLPSPYMTSHLTVLAQRTPIRESYDRVMRAKRNAGRQ
jgi:hypothetical protein